MAADTYFSVHRDVLDSSNIWVGVEDEIILQENPVAASKAKGICSRSRAPFHTGGHKNFLAMGPPQIHLQTNMSLHLP